MNSISAGRVPGVVLLLVYDRVSTLEINGELKESLVFIFDKVTKNLLLDHGLAPVIIEPRLFNFFLSSVREEQGVVRAGNVQVNLVPGWAYK